MAFDLSCHLDFVASLSSSIQVADDDLYFALLRTVPGHLIVFSVAIGGEQNVRHIAKI